jgi:hypothetical protein
MIDGSDCIIGQEHGISCLPVVPGSSWCANHHPDLSAERRAKAERAARASHTRRPDPELKRWAESDAFDWTKRGNATQVLGDAARYVARSAARRGELTPQHATALATLARARLGRRAQAAQAKRHRSYVVETYGNGRTPEPAA